MINRPYPFWVTLAAIGLVGGTVGVVWVFVQAAFDFYWLFV